MVSVLLALIHGVLRVDQEKEVFTLSKWLRRTHFPVARAHSGGTPHEEGSLRAAPRPRNTSCYPSGGDDPCGVTRHVITAAYRLADDLL